MIPYAEQYQRAIHAAGRICWDSGYCVSWAWPPDEKHLRRERTIVALAATALRLAELAASWGCYSIYIDRIDDQTALVY